MSALAHIDEPVRQRRLTAVPAGESKPVARHSWPKGVFPVALLVLLAGGLVGHLVLQTAIQQQAFQLAGLQDQADSLAAQQAILSAALEQQSTPEQLAWAAAGLGMVANPYTTYLDLATGQVSGIDRPVRGDELPAISARPDLAPPDAPIDVVAQAGAPETPDPADQTGADASADAGPDQVVDQ